MDKISVFLADWRGLFREGIEAVKNVSASVIRGARRADNSAGDYITRSEFDAFKKSLTEYLKCLISK